ncbi:MAG TPA: ABC transporter substrate binding protein, partial [Nitrospiraceae bacterium]
MRISDYTSRPFSVRPVAIAPSIAGLAVLLGLLSLLVSLATAADIAILKSSEIAAYDDAVKGFMATAPAGATYTEYNLRGDLELGKKLAKKIRSSDTSLVVAVGLKAALAAKLELGDIPTVFMMVLDPQKHQLNGANMTGTLLEIPVDRQLKLLRTFLPTKHRLGILYDPSKSSSRIKDAEPHAAANDFQLQGFPVASEKDVPQQLRALL